MRKIIVFESETDSLKTFAHLMAEGFCQCGYEVLMADMRCEEETRRRVIEFAGQGETAVLFFNHAGLNLLTEERDSIWNVLEADCYDFIVDHPMYYHAAIIFPVHRLTFLCVDEYHQKFIERFYHGTVRSFFFPLAGIRSEKTPIPFAERSMDILFTGAYLIDDCVEYHLNGLGEGLRQIWQECFEWLKVNTDRTLEQAVEYSMQKRRIQLPEEDLRDTVRMFQDIDGMLRSFARAKVIKTLADHDIKVHIYGEGWEYLDCKNENLVIHKRIPFDETIPLMADAKIVLNVMPWFKSGVHDRVYSAMLNQSVCLTDSSKYMNRTLQDEDNVLFYSLENLEELPDKIRWYLKNPEGLERIAENGYQYAMNTQTWQHRAEQLIEIMEGRTSLFN